MECLLNLNFNWSLIECIAVFFSVAYVLLAARESIWCWLAATISVLLYAYICFEAKLYAETYLQLFYLIMAGYGYLNWKENDEALMISKLSITKHLILIFIGAIITFMIGFYLTTYTNSQMPIVDSFTTVFSIIATFMVTKKIIENWLYWIIIDAVSVYLYYSRDLHLTSILFLAYTIVAIVAYFSWQKKNKLNV